MKRHLLWLAAAILLASPMLLTSCSSDDNPATEPVVVSNPIGKVLSEMPNVHDIVKLEDKDNLGYKEAYDFFFDQPLDHKNPAAGTYRQCVRVCIRDVNAPTVIYTDAYSFPAAMIPSYGEGVSATDLALALGANYIDAEYRYYNDSKILNDPRWDYLTAEQGAGDYYAIIQALKPLLPKEWISTGNSKNGMNSIYLRYYYPDAVDVTTAFCAPFCTTLLDVNVGRYSQQVCGADDVKPILDSHLNRLFANGKEGFYSKVSKLIEERQTSLGNKFEGYSFEQYVYDAVFSNFNLFMNNNAKQRQEQVPPIDCSDDELIYYYYGPKMPRKKTRAAESEGYYWEDNPGYPYRIENVKEQGYAAFDYSLYPQLEGTGFDADKLNVPSKEYNQRELYDCDLWLYDTYDNSLHLDILNNFLPNCTKPLLLVYVKNDSWTGGAVTKVNPVAKLLMNPIGMHNQDINNEENYTPEFRQEIIDYIAKYVKLPEGVIRGDAQYRRTVKR